MRPIIVGYLPSNILPPYLARYSVGAIIKCMGFGIKQTWIKIWFPSLTNFEALGKWL